MKRLIKMFRYQYLLGIFLVGIIWLFFFFARKDLRKAIIWSSWYYVALNVLVFLGWAVGSLFIHLGEPFVPGYWNPATLLNLGQITGGFAIEDGLYMFFVGGIAVAGYEYFFHWRIRFKKKHKHHLKALLVATIVAFLFQIFFKTNLIYAAILFGGAGALVIWLDRTDLVTHSLYGGATYLMIYFFVFVALGQIFPNFVEQNYNLGNLSGVLLAGVPLEELLYSLSFGLLWAPIYEYEHGDRVVKIKR